MKEKKLSKKLLLNKEHIARLNDPQMDAVYGAANYTPRYTCYITCNHKTCGCGPTDPGITTDDTF